MESLCDACNVMIQIHASEMEAIFQITPKLFTSQQFIILDKKIYYFVLVILYLLIFL